MQSTHWTDAARARHFIVPDDAAMAPGAFALRTATGRERSVDEAAVAPYEVTEEEARAWAKEQLGAVFGELRGQTLDFVEKLRQKTAEMKEENRRAWEQAVTDAPPEVREAGSHLRDMLKDLGATLRRAAREHGYNPDPPDPAASASADPATSTVWVDLTDSAASVDAHGSAAASTTPATSAAAADADAPAAPVDSVTPAVLEADAQPSSDSGPDATLAAGPAPAETAARRVDAPAIRLRAEP